ncbi:uncharacterized protein [Spinacia oleracea]|uniref:MULE transposase domain-containing protein n=1 Tax=Spinacia oleracea TaxID=3562 RepID=A0ABM3QR04_SPIOL|nr:uncharacterized protein LOC110792864 [Spinacia oleracea]
MCSPDVYVQTNLNQLMDFGYLFETNVTYKSRIELIKFARDIGKTHKIVVVILSSKGGAGNGSGEAYVLLGCERSLPYHRNISSVQVNTKRSTGSKRCECPFRLNGKEMVGGTWRLLVNDGNHNHDFPAYNVRRSIISRLTMDEKNKTKEMTRAHVTPSQMLVSINNENKENLTTKRDSFEWALRCVRALFAPDHMPEVIVIDREYALIHAIDDVFPKSHHMLCIRHIAKNVEAREKPDTRSALFSSRFLRYWNKIVYAETEAEYEANKVLQAYTKKIFHLGNRTTNRVESAHNALKRFFMTSTGSLDTIWKRLHSLLELQENEIKAIFARSENIDLHITVLHLLSQFRGKVSHLPIRKINEEYGRHKVGTDPATCGCYLRTSHGLPCAYEMMLLDGEGKSIELNDVHIFWRTIHMEGFKTSNTPPDPCSKYQDDDNEILKSFFEKMKNQAPEAKKQYIFQLEKIMHPKSVPLEEPVYDRKPKGRPPSRSSIKRDLSYWEHVQKMVSNRGTQQPSSSNKRKCSSTNKPTREDLISAEIPVHVVPFIYEYKNVGADGNCGYRSVAHQIYGSEDQWRRVRMDLYLFLERRLEFWMVVWNQSQEGALSILRGLNYYEIPCPYDYWMRMDYIGPVIATTYNVTLGTLDPIQIGTMTYLPLYVPEGFTTPEKLIGVASLRSCVHFVSVSLMNECPFPEWGTWFNFHDGTVQDWDAPYYPRIDRWKLLRG